MYVFANQFWIFALQTDFQELVELDKPKIIWNKITLFRNLQHETISTQYFNMLATVFV